MATTTTVSSNYAGKVAGSIIGKSFKQADTLRLGLLTVAQNVNFKMNLRKLRYTDGTTDYSCGHTPAGAIVLSEKIIQPKKVKNDFDICKEDFRQTWSEDLEGASASNPNAPADIMEAIQLEVLSSQAEKVDDEIWSGVNGTDGQIGDGLLVQWASDANVIKVGNGITSVAAATTEANVEAHLKTALSVVPTSIRRKQLTVAVSPDVFQAYSFYLISKGIANDGTADEKQVKFGKYMLTEVNGLPDNTIAVFEKKNVVFATGLTGDHNEISLVDEDSIGLLTGQVRGKMVYNGGVGYYNSEEIVWFLTTA
tara:strand:- start:45 stop:974 length:930 start_codon:yes stop_codon:yes gene_type:complete